jgi:hypothetical protein
MVISSLDPQIFSAALLTGARILSSETVQTLFREAENAAFEVGKQLAGDSGKAIVLHSAEGIKKALGKVFTVLKGSKPHSTEALMQIEETLTNSQDEVVRENAVSKLSRMLQISPEVDQSQLTALTSAVQELQKEIKTMSLRREGLNQEAGTGMVINNQKANIGKLVIANSVGQITL